MRYRARGAVLLIVLYRYGGWGAQQGINRVYIFKAAGLVCRGAAGWRKQLAQFQKHLSTVRIYIIQHQTKTAHSIHDQGSVDAQRTIKEDISTETEVISPMMQPHVNTIF